MFVVDVIYFLYLCKRVRDVLLGASRGVCTNEGNDFCSSQVVASDLRAGWCFTYKTSSLIGGILSFHHCGSEETDPCVACKVYHADERV